MQHSFATEFGYGKTKMINNLARRETEPTDREDMTLRPMGKADYNDPSKLFYTMSTKESI